MEWFVFALIAPFLWAGTDVVDKHILTKHVRNPFSYQLLFLLTEVPIPFLLLAVLPISFCFPWSALGMLAGFLICTSFLFYFKAMTLEETSRVISLMYVAPIFVLPLANIFLGESLSLYKYLGVMSLVFSAVLVSYRKAEGKTSLAISPALGWMLIYDVVFAVSNILVKYVLYSMDYLSFSFWWLIGGLIGGPLLFCFPKARREFLNDFHLISKGVFFLRSISTYLSFVGIVLYSAAVSVGVISLVAAVPSVEPFFVLLLTVLLSFLIPGILEEDTGKQAFTLKISAFALIIFGAWLIAG
ncbi:DMT family transporter [Candidatus Bathyarchaeota archaeon]|nr:DMT family transporter [Candidatus Bathyarchaeota archaeon]